MAARARILVIGDVHGCLEELEQLLEVSAYRPERDRLVFLGDLLDRGPDPVGVVRRVRELGADCLLGNHEEKHLRFAAHEARRQTDRRYRNPVRLDPRHVDEHHRLAPDDLRWMTGLPRWLRLAPGWLAVHGGLLPGRSLDRQPPDWLIRLRFIDPKGKPVHRSRGEAKEAGIQRWPERWSGPESVVYGHHAREAVVVDDPTPGVRCIGIDTGCVYGGKLTALVLPGEELIQVRAKVPLAIPADVED